MKDAFEKAGVNTAQSRLGVLAYDKLKKAKRVPAVAVDTFVDAVMKDAELLRELLDIRRDLVTRSSIRYLHERAAEMEGRASQERDASHAGDDRPSPPANAQASHEAAASQTSADRLGASDAAASQGSPASHHQNDRSGSQTGGPSQESTDSQRYADRPAHSPGRVAVIHHTRKHPAPSTRIKRSAALAVAKTIFDREIGSGKQTIGELTKQGVINIKRRGLIDSTIADGLLEHEWPDDHKTTVRQLLDEQQVKACFERAYRVLDSLGMTDASARIQ